MAETAPGDNVLLNKFEHITVIGLGATSASMTAWVCPNLASMGLGDVAETQWQVVGVSARAGTASSSGTLQVEVAGAATAVGSGTNQLTGTMSLSGTASTTVNGTVIGTPTVLSAGKALNIILAGTLTGLANCAVDIVLQRIA